MKKGLGVEDSMGRGEERRGLGDVTKSCGEGSGRGVSSGTLGVWLKGGKGEGVGDGDGDVGARLVVETGLCAR